MSLNTILATTPLTSTGYHLKATGTTIGNSLIWDNGTNVGIGNTNTTYKFDVTGTGNISSTFTVGANMGMNVTPSAWATVGPVIEFTAGGFVGSQGSTNTMYVGSNNYYNGSNFIYKQNGFATQYQVGAGLGNHHWYIAPTGTAGNNVTFTLAMALTNAGKLEVANRGISTSSMPVGSVIQTVHYQFGTAFSTSSASDIDTGLNLSITPTSSTSKILIIITAYVRATQSGGNCYIYSRLWRGAVGGTSLTNGFAAMGNFASTDIRGVDATSFLDSPATTSAVTYRYSLSSIYAATVYLNSNTNPSTITLMEIAQ